MSQKSTISITFKLDGDNGGFQKLSVDVDGLRKVMKAAVVEAENFKSSIVNFAALATGIDSVNKSFSDLQSALKGLTDAHAAQIEAETKLAVNMRNTMDAREEDIQSIKDLCSAQQQLGVIGDEVQLAGAQELATYLSEKQSLEQLIPVMNDMLAQQYGLNASQENAAQIATMLGKVMDGQTGALSRYGYTFDDTQEQILKFGTEAQRAAVLCDVVSSSVGGMNAELAKTDDGKQKQLENTIGDLKEELGGLVQGAMPFVTIAANTMLALAGTLKFVAGVRTAVTVVAGLNIKQKALNAVMFMATGNMKKAAQAAMIYSAAAKGSAASTLALKIALRGLLIATGIGIAIAALTTIIGYFVSSTDDATESTNKFLDAEERAKREAEQLDRLRKQEASTLTNTRAALEINISKLKEFNGTKEQEKKLVNEMNDTYGDTMGYFSSVADWYNALISNSDAYCRQMVIEARTRMLANQIAEKEQETHDLIYDDAGKKRRYSTVRDVEQYISGYYTPTSSGGGGGPQPQYSQREIPGTSDLDKANAAIRANNAAVANLRSQMTSVAEEAAQITFSVRGSNTRPDAGGNKPETPTDDRRVKTRLEIIRDAREQFKAKWLDASAEERASIEEQITALNKEEVVITAAMRRLDDLGKAADDTLASLSELPAYSATELKVEGLKMDGVSDAGIADYIDSLNEANEVIDIFRQKQGEATGEMIAYWQNAIDAVEKRKSELDGSELKWNINPSNLKEIDENISILTEKLQTASLDEAAIINRQIKGLNTLAQSYRDIGTESQDAFSSMRQGYDSLKGIGSGVESITDALEGNGNAWQTVTGIVDGFLQIYDGIKTIVDIINKLSGVTNTYIAAKTAENVAIGAAAGAQTAEAVAAEANAAAQIPVITANKLATASYMELAAAAYFAAHAYIPFAGFGIASGFVTAATAMVQAIGVMPFADGGIVSGPTVGLIGEYAGASNNPEVVAPLDKLRGMLQPAGQPVIVGGTLRASGRDLVCVLANETRIAGKSGRKTNIKL